MRDFEGSLRAKVAVLRLDQFERGVAGSGIDTTLWARFAQPARLLWVRDAAAQARTAAAVAQAVQTASRWAALLGPEQGPAAAYWDAVFSRTYAAELRVEKSTRAASLAAHDPARYQQALRCSWQAIGLPFSDAAEGVLTPQITAVNRAAAERAWARRARWCWCIARAGRSRWSRRVAPENAGWGDQPLRSPAWADHPE